MFQLSFLGFGPTELRICLIGINIGIIFFGRVGVAVDGQFVSIYDALIGGTGLIFVGIFVARVIAGLRKLGAVEQQRTDPQPSATVQSLSTNASSAAK